MPITKAELECMVEELQRKLEQAQQSKETIEAAVKATVTSRFEEEMARAIAVERKHTTSVQQQLETMQKTAEGLKNEKELAVIRAKDALREDLMRTHRREMETKEELASLQKERGEERIRALELQLAEKDAKIAELEATASEAGDEGGGDLIPTVADTDGGRSTSRRIPLPTIPEFNGEKCDDEDLFSRWTKKLEKYSEIGRWSEREKLLQFELHLVGRAEAVYETLYPQMLRVLSLQPWKHYANACSHQRGMH